LINFNSNKMLKILFIDKGITQKILANELGITEFTLCRWLRKELPSDKKGAILAAIEKLAVERRA
jgi:hypothetical protein